MSITKKIINTTKELVKIPSQGGKNDPTPIIDYVDQWAYQHGLYARVLKNDEGLKTGVVIKGGPEEYSDNLCLNACLDTADIGDAGMWKYDPFEGVISNGKMFGRGVADSKIAVSIFLHVAKEIFTNKSRTYGVHFLFDAYEHDGTFKGVKTYLQNGYKPSTVIIGYPGDDTIYIGSRGFYRVQIDLFGLGGHSGASADNSDNNALYKACDLISALRAEELSYSDQNFPMGAKVTATMINGGKSYSSVPTKCILNLDFRLTEKFGKSDARQMLEKCIAVVDQKNRGKKTTYAEEESWPAYIVNDVQAVDAMMEEVEKTTGERVNKRTCGPSNIGNFFASKKIPAIIGYGVKYGNIHAPNEYIDIGSIPSVYDVYINTIKKLTRRKQSD